MIVSLALSAAFGATPALAAHLTRGFVDDVWFDAPARGISQQSWIRKTVATGAKFVQIEVDWKSIEPRAPRHGDALASPAGPQFEFSALDAHVEELAGSGLQPVFLVTDAPRWAEGKGGTRSEYANGGYEPNAPAFRDLAEAMAKRYSGSYPNPLKPRRKLPPVRYMQAWGEANMNLHLSPQWTRTGGRLQNSGATIYRSLLNAFYTGVKAGDHDDIVLASGLEAYGDPPDQLLQRTRPVTFLEDLLCLTQDLTRAGCSDPAHFDVLASDPYDSFAPTVSAVSPLDASAPDLGRLTKVVKAALSAHTLLPDTPKPLWVTEFGYDSDPPNPTKGTLSTATQARWLEQAFYVFWHEGVSTVLWYLVRDQVPPYSVNYFSGVFFRDGKPKPSYTAYRFPFVVMSTRAEPQAWGIAPVTGTVKVQLRSASGWETVRALHTVAGNVFDFGSAALVHGQYRATAGGQSSLVWSY
jgi:hypothetical protein